MSEIASKLEKIHITSVRMLSELGFLFHSDRALEILKAHGVRVQNGRAYFTERQIMDAVADATKAFTVYARNCKHDVKIDTETLNITPGYGSSYISSADGKLRYSTYDDFLTLANLVQQSPAFDINGGILAQPCDLDASIAAPAMVYATVKRSDKAVFSVSADEKRTREIMELMSLLIGGEELKKKPYTITLISTMSPLAMDQNAIETMMVCAEYNQALALAPGPMAGGTGPVSLAGNIALANAEILAANAFAQCLKKGLPVIYGFAATTSDMRNLSVCNASPGFVKEARYGALMGKKYGFAVRSGGGMSDAGGLTAQAGVESALNLFESFSEKANLVMHAAGSLHSFGSVNYEKFILDIETIDRLRYYYADLSTDEDSLAFEPIKEVVLDGAQFMLHEHTLKRCRLDPWMPQVSLHGKSDGDPNAELYASIRRRMEKMLLQYEKPKLDSGVEKALDDYMLKIGMRKSDVEKT